MVKQLLSIVVLCIILLPCVVAFSIKNNESIQQQETSQRRSFLNKISTTFLIATTTTSTIIPTTITNANAVVLDNSQIKVGTLKELTPEEAEQRFREGRETLDYLLTNYKEVCDGGGDNVRRYLGTVGTSSGLFGIKKAMKTLSDRADDIVECKLLCEGIECVDFVLINLLTSCALI